MHREVEEEEEDFCFFRELPGSLYVDFRMAEAATGNLENQECCMHVLPN